MHGRPPITPGSCVIRFRSSTAARIPHVSGLGTDHRNPWFAGLLLLEVVHVQFGDPYGPEGHFTPQAGRLHRARNDLLGLPRGEIVAYRYVASPACPTTWRSAAARTRVRCNARLGSSYRKKTELPKVRLHSSGQIGEHFISQCSVKHRRQTVLFHKA